MLTPRKDRKRLRGNFLRIKRSPSAGEWLSDRLIQVVQNTGQNTVKMPFYIT